ncbi:glycosyltransferase like family 2-domain-containing protein [Aspergillus californicus]
MDTIAEGDEEETILVPMSLVALAESTDAAPGSSRSHTHPPIPTPSEEIHIQKRRQSRSGSVSSGRLSAKSGDLRSTCSSRKEGHPGSLRLNWRDVNLRPAEQPGVADRGVNPRDGSLPSFYNMANLVKIKHQRELWFSILVEYGTYTLMASFVYFGLIGLPLWKGGVYYLYWLIKHKFTLQGGWSVAVGALILYSYIPLLALFEDDAPGPEFYNQRNIQRSARDTALLVPAYRSAPILGRTLEAALKTFQASQIYVVANGNCSTPLDNTEEVCQSYGVNHIWCPIGSKIIAIFVGCYAVKRFRYVLLLDDDCALPENFPVVVSRLTNTVRCIGYTITSRMDSSSARSWCQQAQDLEYKLAGLQRCFAGRVGSAAFPHGAVSLWDRDFLEKILEDHPGFSISEDWFMGNSCRRLGGRVQMCSAAFVETGTPSSLLFTRHRNGKRGGFGETSVFSQRFRRWNFFVATGLWHNFSYILGSWKLGKWELGTKIFIWQEVWPLVTIQRFVCNLNQIYETIFALLAPFILPISLFVQPWFCASITAGVLALYLLQATIFNALHLRLKKRQVPYKVFLGLVNVASCYWSLFNRNGSDTAKCNAEWSRAKQKNQQESDREEGGRQIKQW